MQSQDGTADFFRDIGEDERLKLQNKSEKDYSVIRGICSVLLLVFFLILSFIIIDYSPKQAASEYRSSMLAEKTVVAGNVERTDYLDEHGNITVAYDLGYATKIITKTHGGKTEAYYDSEGNPVKCVSGYYSVYHEYDDEGYNTFNIFLGDDGEPVMLPSGYSIEKNLFNDSGQKETILFLDANRNPVCSAAEGYGKQYEYNPEGRVFKVTYLDQSGNPMVVKNGYASILRTFYLSKGAENGKIEYEFYYDAQGEPVALSLGQYGIHREYNENGDNTVITCLDAEGNPIITTKGFTTVLKDYQGSSYIERYLDIDGNPFKLPEGQYGTKTTNGKVVYLDANGYEQFNKKTFLNQQPVFAIVFALGVVILSFMINKRLNIIILIFYFIAVLYFTLMYREKPLSTNAFFSFSAYRQFFVNDEAKSSIIKNIWLFIPLGAILYQLFPQKKALLIVIIISLIIELTQYVTGLGWCDMDDVISNSLGGFIGYGTGKVLKKYRINKKKKPRKQ